MATPSPKNPRVKLELQNYGKVHRAVLQRDGWRCQFCGSVQHLQVHHIQFRSHSGSDTEENLITLCAACHAQVHRKAASQSL